VFGGNKSGLFRRFYLVAAAVVSLAGLLLLGRWLRQLDFLMATVPFYYVQIVASLLSLIFAAHAAVRFRGTSDRLNLTLAFGFALAGLISTISIFAVYAQVTPGNGQAPAPLFWMVGRTLLALVVLAALVVERRVPHSRDPVGEAAIAFGVVCAVAYLTGVTYFGAPIVLQIHENAWLARPWDLLPAALFLAGAIGFERRLHVASSAFDRAFCTALWVSVGSHVVMTQSTQIYDAPFMTAEIMRTVAVAIALVGTVLDNSRLFEQVRQLAVSDSLTGLANYRWLVQVLHAEIQRSQRSGRPFAILLLDLDHLKLINDRYGHLVGSRALCRLGRVLRTSCRAMDTAARYGGDEFVLVLPEAGAEAAERVGRRIRERLSSDGEEPMLSVSVGAAVFPQDGSNLEELLGAADRALYGMKRGPREVRSLTHIAACL
jgi:diguanylate cyclase (GGDEF)-like protein